MEPSWEWHVGDPVGFGNEVGSPEVPYMDYANKSKETEEERRQRENEEAEQRRISELRIKSNRISDEAWKLNEEERYEEALVFINRSLEYYEKAAKTWNRKAIILDNLNRYDEAIISYDKAIELDSKNETFKHNKALCLLEQCYILKDQDENHIGLNKINESLNIIQQLDNKEREDEIWNLKGIFLERLDRIPEAFDCYKKAIELAKDDDQNKKVYKENRDKLLPFIDSSDMICPKCGNNLNITDNFCLRCGTRIEKPAKLIFRKETDSNNKRNEKSRFDNTASEIIIDIDEE